METAPAHGLNPLATIKELRHYVHLLRKRWHVVLAAVVASGCVAFVYTIRQPGIHEATCSVLIEPNAPRVLEGVKDVIQIGADWNSWMYYKTQYRIIQSHEIAQKVLDLVGPGAVSPGENDAKPIRQAQVNALLGQIKVVGVKESSIVNITARDRDPERASRIANAFADAYVERNIDYKLEGTRSASSWLGEQTVDLRKRLEDSELALYQFKKDHGLLDLGLDDKQGMTRENLQTLNQKISDVKARRIEAESIRKLILNAKSDIAEKESLPEIRDNPVVTKLRENYLDLLKIKADLESRYGDKHPRIENIQQQIQATRRDYNHELDQVLKAFDKKYQAIVETEAALNRWMHQEKNQALDLAKLEVQYRPMARDAENNAKVFGQVTQRHKEIDLTGLSRANNIRVLDRAIGQGRQVSPNLRLNLSVALVLGFLVGVLLVFAMDALDNTVKTPEVAEAIVGAPLLGVLPVLTEAKQRLIADAPARDLTVHHQPKSLAAEACRSIRTNLMFLSAQKEVQLLVVTSPSPKDGKTTAAISLAITMAQAGARVLIIDTDLRKPRIHSSFGLKPDKGISNAIMGEATVKELIFHSEIPNLDVLPCGPVPPNPAELLHTDRFKEILAQCRGSYDKVVLDSPPTGPVTDPAIIGSLTDGVLLVLRAGHTTRDAATYACRHLTDGGARILGLVINQTDRKGGKYGYGYGYGYYAPGKRYYQAT